MFLKQSEARRVYYIMSVIATLANYMAWTVTTVYFVTVVKLDPLQLVLVGTVMEGAVLLCEIPTGVVADTFSRKLSITIGLVIEGLSFLILGFLPDITGVMLFSALFGMGDTFISGATEAWIAGEVGEEQVGQVFLRKSQLCQGVGIIGTIASVLLAYLGLFVPVVIAGGMYLLLALYVALRMPETGFKPVPRGERNSFQAMGQTLVEGFRVIRGKPLLLTIIVTSIFMGAYSEGFDRLWQAFFLQNIPFPGLKLTPVTWFGIMSIGGQLIYFGALSILRKRLNTTSATATVQWLIVCTILEVISILILGLAGNFWVALLAIWAKGLIGSITQPLYNTWLTQNIEPHVRATVFSVNNQANAFGQIAGGPGVGAIGSTFSLRAAILVSACLLSPVILIYRRTLKRPLAALDD